MNYKILEARVEFEDNNLSRVTVLVDCTGTHSKPLSDVRAIFATTKPRSGYMNIAASDQISPYLLQQVAAQGRETVDRDEIFPHWKAHFLSKQL